jgi:hypothetical protein
MSQILIQQYLNQLQDLRKVSGMSAPCSVNAKGARRSPIFAPGLDITSCDLQFSNSLAESGKMEPA